MKTSGRIVLVAAALAVSLAVNGLRAQDIPASTVSELTAVPAPDPAESPDPAEEAAAADADEPSPTAAEEALQAAAAEDEAAVSAPAGSGEQESRPAAVEVATLLPPRPVVPEVDTAIALSRPAREGPAPGPSRTDWIALGIVAMAIASIIAKLTSGEIESVSIRGEQPQRRLPSPSVPRPPSARPS